MANSSGSRAAFLRCAQFWDPPIRQLCILHMLYSGLVTCPLYSGQPRRIAAKAKTPIWIARTPDSLVKGILVGPARMVAIFFAAGHHLRGNFPESVAADLLIGDSERRRAAVLLRLSGHRLAGRKEVKPVEVILTQNELAGAANCVPKFCWNNVAQVGRTRAGGEIGYGGIKLCSPASLRAFVEVG